VQQLLFHERTEASDHHLEVSLASAKIHDSVQNDLFAPVQVPEVL